MAALDTIFQLAMGCQKLGTPEACTQQNDFPLMDLRFVM